MPQAQMSIKEKLVIGIKGTSEKTHAPQSCTVY
ncbi:MAG: hypothetical protein Ta2F_14430 [Termitinemataceae bacterium]|nr:MAG: hypothetical protein Ta2F_14430 [Termitinemataceae bacterium]